jgi:hypothetical protein
MEVGDVLGGFRKKKKKEKVMVVLAVRCGKTKSQQTVDLEFLGEVINLEVKCLKNNFFFFFF